MECRGGKFVTVSDSCWFRGNFVLNWGPRPEYTSRRWQKGAFELTKK